MRAWGYIVLYNVLIFTLQPQNQQKYKVIEKFENLRNECYDKKQIELLRFHRFVAFYSILCIYLEYLLNNELSREIKIVDYPKNYD